MKPEKPPFKQRWKAIVDDFFELVFTPIFCVLALLVSVGAFVALVAIAWAHFNP